MNQTMQAMYDFIVQNPNSTELEIARGVGLKKTPYTRTILLNLWHEGYVVRWYDDQHQPRPAYCFFVQLTQPMEGV